MYLVLSILVVLDFDVVATAPKQASAIIRNQCKKQMQPNFVHWVLALDEKFPREHVYRVKSAFAIGFEDSMACHDSVMAAFLHGVSTSGKTSEQVFKLAWSLQVYVRFLGTQSPVLDAFVSETSLERRWEQETGVVDRLIDPLRYLNLHDWLSSFLDKQGHLIEHHASNLNERGPNKKLEVQFCLHHVRPWLVMFIRTVIFPFPMSVFQNLVFTTAVETARRTDECPMLFPVSIQAYSIYYPIESTRGRAQKSNQSSGRGRVDITHPRAVFALQYMTSTFSTTPGGYVFPEFPKRRRAPGSTGGGAALYKRLCRMADELSVAREAVATAVFATEGDAPTSATGMVVHRKSLEDQKVSVVVSNGAFYALLSDREQTWLRNMEPGALFTGGDTGMSADMPTRWRRPLPAIRNFLVQHGVEESVLAALHVDTRSYQYQSKLLWLTWRCTQSATMEDLILDSEKVGLGVVTQSTNTFYRGIRTLLESLKACEYLGVPLYVRRYGTMYSTAVPIQDQPP